MSDLEFRYRQALRWYPKTWREANGDALIGTLLDLAADADRTEPGRGELADLYRSALAIRLGALGRTLRPAVRQYASLLALALGTSISLAGIFFGSSSYQFANRIYQDTFSLSTLVQSLSSGQVLYVFWIIAFVAALAGWRRAAIVAVLAATPVSIVWSAIAIALSDYGHPSPLTLAFLALLALVAASGLASDNSRYRTKLTVATVSFAALLAGSYWLRGYGGGYWGNGARYVDYFWSGLAVWLIFAGIPVAVAVAIAFWRLKLPDRAAGVLLAASPLVPLALFAFGWSNAGPNIAEVLVSVIIGVALIVGILRLFGLHIRITRV